jgi:3-hydroxyisobutyrate dehydrogenase-like beta-hydroxyacid dehydrogenase
MLHGKFDGRLGFALDGAIKDASHIRQLAADTNAPMPMIDVAYQHLLTARALHAADARAGVQEFPVLDWSALVAGVRAAAGLNGLHLDEVC